MVTEELQPVLERKGTPERKLGEAHSRAEFGDK